MAKRFTDTNIWGEDWFLEMPNEYKLFWYYMLSNCDHSGIYKVNLRSFCSLNEVKLTSTKALEYFNIGKQRIRVIQDNVWFIEDFFVYQYGETFNTNNRVHESIKKVYEKYNIELTSIRGLKDHKDRVKDKDKDIDKDKDKEVIKEKEIKKLKFNNNISLSEEEHNKLVVEFGEMEVWKFYDYLSAYKVEKSYKTKSDYLTIKRWVIDAVLKQNKFTPVKIENKYQSQLDSARKNYKTI
jgi:hypothetical protein